ncbi:MAG: AAA family ATPase [Cyanobacteria bacterium P01_G01_bin.39]
MKVKQLQIDSFRGIKSLTLDFDLKEPTVFLGVNGSGKSSILDCLAILLSWFNTGVQDIHRQGNDFSDSDINNQSEKTENEIMVYTNESELISWTLKKIRDKWRVQEKRRERIVAGVYDLVQQAYKSYENNSYLPIAIYYPTQRFVLNVPLETKDNLFDTLNAYNLALDNKNIDFKDFFEWFRNREDLENENFKYNPDSGKDRELEAVRTAIYQMLEGFSNLRVERYPLQMTLEKNGQKLVVNQLSDGEKGLLAMVGDIARRLAMVSSFNKDALQGEAIVLIDQIELHLHPLWQREIISELKRTFPNCQFIITTHSPQVVSNIKPENIYVLETTAEGVTARHPQSSYGRDSNSILEDVMGVSERPLEIKQDLLKLFQIIEEGNLEAAQELRQEIADKIGADEPELIKAATSIRRREILNR